MEHLTFGLLMKLVPILPQAGGAAQILYRPLSIWEGAGPTQGQYCNMCCNSWDCCEYTHPKNRAIEHSEAPDVLGCPPQRSYPWEGEWFDKAAVIVLDHISFHHANVISLCRPEEVANGFLAPYSKFLSAICNGKFYFRILCLCICWNVPVQWTPSGNVFDSCD